MLAFQASESGSIPERVTGRELVWSFSARLKSERTSFDSTAADCDVRELANPVRCERISDGIETRTSPRTPRGSASVDGGLSSRDETGALPVRGTKCRAAHGGQPVSKSGEQRSIRWLGAMGMCRRLRACLASMCSRSVTGRLHQTVSQQHCSRPMARSAAWYAARADSISDGSSRSRWRTSSPSAQKLNEAPARDRRDLERPRRKGECSRQEHLLSA